MNVATQNGMTEWAYSSGKTHADPFSEVERDVIVTDPDWTPENYAAPYAAGISGHPNGGRDRDDLRGNCLLDLTWITHRP